MLKLSSFVLLVVLALQLSASAQSLLDNSTQDSFDAPKRRRLNIHDHLKIIVNDRSRASSKADLRTDRRTRWESEFDRFIRFDLSKKAGTRLRSADLTDDPQIDLDSRFRQDNIGKTGRDFLLSFTVTAEVIEIQPNGNLVVQARRKRKINDEYESIKLTGVVSDSSVKEGNIVMSDDIADLNLAYDGDGSVSDAQKQGFLAWLISKIWPF